MQVEHNQLSDARWQIIEQILNDHRKRKHNLRDVVDCILEILRTGTQWRNLRHPTLPWQIVYWKASPVLFPQMAFRWDAGAPEQRVEQNRAQTARQTGDAKPSVH